MVVSFLIITIPGSIIMPELCDIFYTCCFQQSDYQYQTTCYLNVYLTCGLWTAGYVMIVWPWCLSTCLYNCNAVYSITARAWPCGSRLEQCEINSYNYRSFSFKKILWINEVGRTGSVRQIVNETIADLYSMTKCNVTVTLASKNQRRLVLLGRLRND